MRFEKVKTGAVSMADAISTTNLQSSYKSGNPIEARNEHREKLDNELEQWKKRTIIRVLVYSQKDYTRDENVEDILRKEPKTSDDELFFLCDKPYIKDLLGDTFARLAEAKTQDVQDVEQLIETRANKRSFQNMEQEKPTAILTDRKKQKNGATV